jgi:hypothetical protein
VTGSRGPSKFSVDAVQLPRASTATIAVRGRTKGISRASQLFMQYNPKELESLLKGIGAKLDHPIGSARKGIAWPSADQATDPRSQARSRHRRIEATSLRGRPGSSGRPLRPLNGGDRRSLIRQRNGYLQVGASRCLLLVNWRKCLITLCRCPSVLVIPVACTGLVSSADREPVVGWHGNQPAYSAAISPSLVPVGTCLSLIVDEGQERRFGHTSFTSSSISSCNMGAARQGRRRFTFRAVVVQGRALVDSSDCPKSASCSSTSATKSSPTRCSRRAPSTTRRSMCARW